MVMNFKWIPPSVIRKVHLDNDIVPVATSGLRKTMIKNGKIKMNTQNYLNPMFRLN